MSPPTLVALSPDGRELVDLLAGFEGRSGRLLGLAGAPGAGKSTLATAVAALARTAGHRACVVAMDGFHLADVELARRGLLGRKGAPETFDAEGYAALLARVRDRAGLVMAPGFDRDLEQPLAGAVPVPADTAIVITEGNYLLLPGTPWPAVRSQLDEVWHLRVDDALRRDRLVARHVEFGKSQERARAWVERVDQPNAALVATAADRADLVLDLTHWRGHPG